MKSKVSKDKREAALKRIEAGETLVSIAKEFGVSTQTVSAWKKKRRLVQGGVINKSMEELMRENNMLKIMLADFMLKKQA